MYHTPLNLTSWSGGMITERRVSTNGISINIAECGEGPLVLLLHGFPESWYSWRHQLEPISAAGYRVVAPDMRGYGKSDKPTDISAYNQVEVVNDVIGLISALGYETAIVIGHDWGAPTAWSSALWFPDKVTAVGALSVPFQPRADTPPLERMKAIFKDQFFYQLYFQEPGLAEKEWEADIRTNLLKFLYVASGNRPADQITKPRPANSDFLSDVSKPETLPPWLTEADLDFYTAEFDASGFRGPLNYYRNHNLTWELTADKPTKILQPALFAAGDRDGVIMMAAQVLKTMPEHVKDLRTSHLIPGIGHWTQQEAPDEVNCIILNFLDCLN